MISRNVSTSTFLILLDVVNKAATSRKMLCFIIVNKLRIVELARGYSSAETEIQSDVTSKFSEREAPRCASAQQASARAGLRRLSRSASARSRPRVAGNSEPSK